MKALVASVLKVWTSPTTLLGNPAEKLVLPPPRIHRTIELHCCPTTPLEVTELHRLPPSKSRNYTNFPLLEVTEVHQLPPSKSQNYTDYPLRSHGTTPTTPPPSKNSWPPLFEILNTESESDSVGHRHRPMVRASASRPRRSGNEQQCGLYENVARFRFDNRITYRQKSIIGNMSNDVG